MIDAIRFEHTRVTVDISGALSVAELRKANQAILCRPDFVGILRQLWRLAPGTSFQLTAADLQYMISLTTALAATKRVAYVALVAPHDLAFGISRMYQSYADGAHWETQVFRREVQAHAWLSGELIDETG